MAHKSLPRIDLAHLPTPLDPLPRLTADLKGPELWVKRDDQTGLAFGGNKTRKLEFLTAEARDEGADLLITTGAPQSNHCRQTAAAAARLGMACQLVLTGSPPPSITGNILLDSLVGAEIVWAEGKDRDSVLDATFQRARQAGHLPFLIPYGGSSPTGIAGYVAAMQELSRQDLEFDMIVLASSSGGTQAGLLVGGREVGFKGRILGISVDRQADELQTTVSDLANQTADRLGLGFKFEARDVDVDDRFLGGGYAVVGELERQAVRRFAQLEGILLDPVYTGRAAGGLLRLIEDGEIESGARVLFWHTGGTPALFAFADHIV
jgi:D-cysteine desulfhydrase family pyridoxal phosphate-dependent enzyme